ncbi:MAG: biotin/lipoyl-binding protein [Acidobacteria bacterium]|nr:biotin/lipoyl-binding protein [Acidobacteriota bacterium]
MKLVIIAADGEESHIEIERVGGGYLVELDGKRYEVDQAAAGGRGRSLLIEGRQREISIVREQASRYRVSSPGGEETVEVLDPLEYLARTSVGEAAVLGDGSVSAYMPGHVVALLVGEGDTVAVGQGIVVLQAMKMENEIDSVVAGVVKTIFVKAGQSVERGDPLFEIEPS